MSIDVKLYEMLEKLKVGDNSFNISNGLLGCGYNCPIDKREIMTTTIVKFLTNFNQEDQIKYMNAYQYGIILSNK